MMMLKEKSEDHQSYYNSTSMSEPNVMTMYSIVFEIFTKTQKGQPVAGSTKTVRITKDSTIHRLGTINVFSKFCPNPFCRC